MREIKTYIEKFTNEYGENFFFDYNSQNDMGILWGDDSLIEGDIFYVFDGKCPELILSCEEKLWLNNIWTKHSNGKDVYLNYPTSCKISNITYLTNNYCPICLRQKQRFEWHHCVMASTGGSDDKENVLSICGTCHSIITSGDDEDSTPMYLAAIYHQIMIYGINFYKQDYTNNKRYNGNINIYLYHSHMKQLLDTYNSLNENEQTKYNNNIKMLAKYYYKYYRSISMKYIENEMHLRRRRFN